MTRRPDYFARLLGAMPNDAVRVTALRRPFAGTSDEGPLDQAPTTPRSTAPAPGSALIGTVTAPEAVAGVDRETMDAPVDDHMPTPERWHQAESERDSKPTPGQSSAEDGETAPRSALAEPQGGDRDRFDDHTTEHRDAETSRQAPRPRESRVTRVRGDAANPEPEFAAPALFAKAEPLGSPRTAPLSMTSPGAASARSADHDTVEIGPIEIVLMPAPRPAARRRERRPMSRGPAVFGLRQG
jgi:hypothetical protein